MIPSLDLVVVRNGTYVKSPCAPIADPNLLSHYPSDGLVPGQGTIGPDRWSDTEFLQPIVDSITSDTGGGGDGGDAGAAPAADPAGAQSPEPAATAAACGPDAPPPPAVPVVEEPPFTG